MLGVSVLALHNLELEAYRCCSPLATVELVTADRTLPLISVTRMMDAILRGSSRSSLRRTSTSGLCTKHADGKILYPQMPLVSLDSYLIPSNSKQLR